MYVCVCIACMSMYRMYLSVLYELILYLLLLQRQAQESPQRPLMTVSCGGTRQASLRAPQVMVANTFFLHPWPLRKPDFAPPPLLPPPRSLNRPPPPLGWIRSQDRSELVDPVPRPVPAYWGSFVASWDIQRLPQPPKDPSPPWLAHACMCLYVHVCAFIACICMCMYVLSVCVCIWLEEINTPKFL